MSRAGWAASARPCSAGASAARRPQPNMERGLDKWLDDAPRLECDWDPLKHDLPAQPRRPRRAALLAADRCRAQPAGRRAALVHDDVRPRQHLHQPAGAAVRARARRDARCAALGIWQGTRRRRLPRRGPGADPARDALRRDDRLRGATALAVLRQRRRHAALRDPARRVRALDRRHRAGARRWSTQARAALHWIDEYADLQGNGYVSYKRRNEKTGLENQCWKDSWDSISYRDGRLPGFPRATCELQGYAYDAKMRGARLARQVWNDPDYADAAREARPPT